MKSNRISTTALAKICGVSQGTVDRALNGRKGISPVTKERILAAAEEYGYRPNIHASCIAGGKSKIIGIVVFDLNNQYFTDIVTSIEKQCAEKGYSAVIMFTDKSRKKELECIEKLYDMYADGIVLLPCGGGEEYENYLLSLEIPIVTIGNKLNKFPYVGIDNRLSMKECAEYALNCGYKKLIYVKPTLNGDNIYAQKERLEEFLSTVKKYNIPFSLASLESAEAQIESDLRCAFICPTDIYAIKLLPLAKRHNVGIIGFDNIRIIDELELELDSVAYDIEQTAKSAVGYLVENKPIADFVKHRIVKRGSIKCR